MNEELFSYSDYIDTEDIQHHGIKGQKWGVRRFQNKDGSLTSKGKSRYSSENRSKEESTSKKSNISDNTIESVCSKPVDKAFKDMLDINLASYEKLKKTNYDDDSYDELVKKYESDVAKLNKRIVLDPMINDDLVKLKEYAYASDDLFDKYLYSETSEYFKKGAEEFKERELKNIKDKKEKENLLKYYKDEYEWEEWREGNPYYDKVQEQYDKEVSELSKKEEALRNDIVSKITKGYGKEKYKDSSYTYEDMARDQIDYYKYDVDNLLTKKVKHSTKSTLQDLFSYSDYVDTEDIQHFGIKGQKWGIRRFQNKDGSLTDLGKSKYSNKDAKQLSNSIKKAIKKESRYDSYPQFDRAVILKFENQVRKNDTFNNLKSKLTSKYQTFKKAFYEDDLDYLESDQYDKDMVDAYNATKKWYKENYPDELKKMIDDNNGDEASLDDFHDFRKMYEGFSDEYTGKGEQLFRQSLKDKGIDPDRNKKIVDDFYKDANEIAKEMLGKLADKNPNPPFSKATNADMLEQAIIYVIEDEFGDIKHY